MPSLEKALELAEERARARGVHEIFVIGGAGLFAQALPLAGRIYLTRVHAVPEGDVRWDAKFGSEWAERMREDWRGSRDEFPVTGIVLDRVRG